MKKTDGIKVLAGAIALGAGLQKAPAQIDTTRDKTQQETVKTLTAPERAKQQFSILKQEAVYDKDMKASFVFSKPLQDQYVDALMKQENIYYADPSILIVSVEEQTTLDSLQKQGYAYKKVADNVYTVDVKDDIYSTKESIQTIPGVRNVTYNYLVSPSVGGARMWNDPGIWHDSGSTYDQQWLHDDLWKMSGVSNVVTQSVDSIEAVKCFHDQQKITMHVIDMGANVNSPEFNMKGSHNLGTGETGNSESNHGNGVVASAVGILGNNYAGGGVAPGFSVISYDVQSVSQPTKMDGLYIITALQKIHDYAVAHPDETNVINMSFGTTIDDINRHNKIQEIQGLQNGTQNFFTGASGNNGNNLPVDYPAKYSEVFAMGSTKANDRNRGLWTGTQVDNTLDFVIDGASAYEMQSTDGSLVQSSGTSFASPKGAGVAAQHGAQVKGAGKKSSTGRPTATPDASKPVDMGQLYTQMRKGSVKTGVMNGVDLYYVSAWRVLRERVVENLPDTIDAQNNPDFKIDFTPKFYNTDDVTMQTDRKMLYPNGQPIPSTVDSDTGLITFHIAFTTNNGFVSGKPARLAYKFTGFVGENKVPYDVDIPKTIVTNNVVKKVNTATDEISLPKVQVRPNPVVDKLNIRLPQEVNGTMIMIYDVSGRHVKTLSIEGVLSSGQPAQVNLSDLPTGFYTAKFYGKVTPGSTEKPIAAPVKIVKK